jgi:hypothetical protein
VIELLPMSFQRRPASSLTRNPERTVEDPHQFRTHQVPRLARIFYLRSVRLQSIQPGCPPWRMTYFFAHQRRRATRQSLFLA